MVKKFQTLEQRGGVEAINLAYVKNSIITGSGTIHSVNGDAVDIDSSDNIRIENITVKNNDGSGIHFGSPRPVNGSRDNLVIGVTAIGNGFLDERNGFDLSWPNPRGAIFINCVAKDNYRNYQIEAVGGVVINSMSVNTGIVIDSDDFSGADYVFINGENKTNKSLFSKRLRILIHRDINRILGRQTADYLNELEY